MSNLSQIKTIVVVGGTGAVRQNMVDAILATGKYSVIVFSCEECANLPAEDVIVVSVDYNDHNQLVKALPNVHIVISRIDKRDESCRDAQLALLTTSIEAGVKRFVPSELDDLSEKNKSIDLYTKFKKPVIDAIKKSDIEYTLFANGLFCNTTKKVIDFYDQ